MATRSLKKLWVIIILVTQQALTLANATSYSRKRVVPALYVFGDSTVDAGNNNNLNTPARANTYPYGIDFFNNCSTGRFTNGKTFADIIAIRFGLPMPPPYLGQPKTERYIVATGINYASGSCGILNSTRDGDCLSLDKQIEYFTSTVKNDLPRNMHSKTKLRQHLSKSIYLISIGSNDYLLNYLRNPNGVNNNLNPEDYANYLLDQLASHIKRIYDLGARKFVVSGIGPVGCIPAMRTPHSQDCNEDVNQKIKPYSDKLPGKLHELQTQLSHSLFISMDSYNFFQKLRNCPESFGFTNIVDSCIQGGKPCKNRNQYFFYDFAHSGEAANKIYAKECFSGTQLCFPQNIKKLVHTH